MSIEARIEVTLEDHSKDRKYACYLATRQVVFPIDPTRFKVIILKVGTTTVHLVPRECYYQEDYGMVVRMNNLPLTNGDRRTEDMRQFFAKNSGWEVRPIQ